MLEKEFPFSLVNLVFSPSDLEPPFRNPHSAATEKIRDRGPRPRPETQFLN
jgi:hypothetical protein